MTHPSQQDCDCPVCGDEIGYVPLMTPRLRNGGFGNCPKISDKPTLMLPIVTDSGLCSYGRMEEAYYQQQNRENAAQRDILSETGKQDELDPTTVAFLQRLENSISATAHRDMSLKVQR